MIILRLDKNGGINKGDIKAFEHDNKSETYIIQLYKNNEVYDLTNKTVELTIVEKKRKYGDMVTLPVESATEGKVKLEIVSSITKQDGTYDFKLTVKDTAGLIETFPNFQVEIDTDITKNIAGEIVADKNFTILTEGLKALSEYEVYKTNAKKVPDIEKNVADLGSQLDNKASKAETQNIQTQINNLVLGAVGDGNNAEVIQARGNYNILNDRLNTNDTIRSNEKLTNNEIASCFNFSENLWVHGDISINFAKGDTWKFKDIQVEGLTPGEKYTLTFDKPINHVNTKYVIELLIEGEPSKKISFANNPYTFTTKSSVVVLRFQAIADVASTYTGMAVYTGISIRKSNITLKDVAILKEYDIGELKRIDDIFYMPTLLLDNEDISKTGGVTTYDNIVLTYTAKENKEYYVSYDEVIGNRLSKGEGLVIYQCYDSKGTNLIGNVKLLHVGGEKEGVFTTPSGTTTIKIIFMITHGSVFDTASEVTWRGVTICEGHTPKIILKKEVIPKDLEIPIPDDLPIEINQVKGLDTLINIPRYILKGENIEAFGGANAWTNKKMSFEVEELQDYTVSYEELIGNKLADGQATIIYQCVDGATGTIIQNNTNLLYVGGDKQATLRTPEGTTKLVLMFIVTLADSFGQNFSVEWRGLKIHTGTTEEITLKEDVVNDELFELHLPNDIYVAIGYPLEIYNHTLCRCINIDNYVFEWKLPNGGGKAFKDKILLSPSDELSGTTDILTLNVYNKKYKLVGTQSSTIHYVKPTSLLSPSVRKVLCIGDSLTDIDVWRVELYTRFAKDIASGKIQYLGTLGTTPYLHEGHSGWSLNNYLADSSEGWNGNYKIKVAVAPNISPKKQYKFGSKIFEYEKTEIENGSIWVYFNRISGGGFVSVSDSPCKEVNSAISGDSSIAFTDCKVTSFNPFYNNGFDCVHYSNTHLGGSIPNDVIIWLGTNGGSPNMDLTTVKNNVAKEMNKYLTIINNIVQNWSNTKIFMCYLHYRPNQDGQGYTSGITNSKAWDNYIFEFNKQLYETFKDYSNIIFVPVGQTFDRVNNYPNRQMDINTRNTTKVSVAGDTVHMDRSTGFLQVADAIYGAYINNI